MGSHFLGRAGNWKHELVLNAHDDVFLEEICVRVCKDFIARREADHTTASRGLTFRDHVNELSHASGPCSEEHCQLGPWATPPVTQVLVYDVNSCLNGLVASQCVVANTSISAQNTKIPRNWSRISVQPVRSS